LLRCRYDLWHHRATGYGEDIVRVLLSRMAVDQLRAGLAAPAAAQAAVDYMAKRVGGTGGLAMLDFTTGSSGVGIAFNTPRMAFAYQTSEDGGPLVGIDPADVPRSIHKKT